jgi:hypothetical protein
MSTFLCPVVEIGKTAKHPNADQLGVTHVFGNCVVFRLGDFKEGDNAVFLPEESLLPEVPRWEFLWANRVKEGKPIRETDRVIKAKKLRGIFSCGMVIPIPALDVGGDGGSVVVAEVGQDLAAALGITKYEQPEKAGTGGDNEPSPSWMRRYTDIENARGPLYREKENSPSRFDVLEGKNVVMTEKLHGCLVAESKIVMANGERKSINRIQVGEYVLGERNGQVIPSLVQQVHNNGCAERWLRVETTRLRIGCGNHYARVLCTPNHKFYTHNGYVAASELGIGDTVFMVREDFRLTPAQEQVILGKLLGDGYLHIAPSDTAGVQFGHKDTHKEYLDWSDLFLGSLATGYRNLTTSGYGTQMLCTNTRFSRSILEAFSGFKDITGRRSKVIPRWVKEKLGPISMAFWYMDDGSLAHNETQEDRALFATCGFTQEECDILKAGLAKFDIHAIVYQTDDKKYYRMRLNETEAEKFFLLVAPFIPPCMQYKLPQRYRGGTGWAPTAPQEYKQELVEQTITRLDDATSSINSSRYDLTTETSNYFAHGILVHNSNARAAWVDGRFWVGSHNNVKTLDGANIWTSAAKRQGLDKICEKYSGFLLFGEVVGPVQKGYDYGLKHPTFVLFDIVDVAQETTPWLSWNHVQRFAAETGIPIVPELYRGPWVSPEHADSLADGPTVFGKGKHGREGVVVKADPESYDEFLGRVILKVIGSSYLLSKYGH